MDLKEKEKAVAKLEAHENRVQTQISRLNKLAFTGAYPGPESMFLVKRSDSLYYTGGGAPTALASQAKVYIYSEQEVTEANSANSAGSNFFVPLLTELQNELEKAKELKQTFKQ